MEVQDRAFQLQAAGRDIVHMEIGQPDFGAPPQVVEAARHALTSQRLGYTSALGLPELREAISRFYAERHGVRVPAERIAVTTGSSGAFLLALGALLDPGDELLLPDPSYPCNRHIARAFEARTTALPVDHRSGYQPTPEQVRRAWTRHTRGLVLASPSNPAGTTIGDSELAALVETVRSLGGFVLVDEIYQGLTYGSAPRSAVHLGDDLIVTNSFSKYFSMTGWRLGWVVAPGELIREMEKLAQNLYVSPPSLSQYAALAAFQSDTLALLDERRDEFRRRRDFLVPALRDIGFSIPLLPQGAFYVYAGCERFAADSHALAFDLLEQAGVALTPGIDFGNYRAAAHLRFAYTCAMERIEEALNRLDRRLKSKP